METLFCSLFSIGLQPLFTSESNVYEAFVLSVISRVSIKDQNLIKKQVYIKQGLQILIDW